MTQHLLQKATRQHAKVAGATVYAAAAVGLAG
jgi:hypothetical protein